MQRILHVTESFGAGVQHAIAQYCRSLPEAKHTVLAMRRPEDLVTDDAARLVEVPSLWQLRSSLAKLSADNDIVHAHSSIAGGIARLTGAHVRSKLIYSPHALAYLGPHSKSKKWLLELAERMLANRVRGFGSVSHSEAEELHSLGVPRDRIVHIPHAITVPNDETQPHPRPRCLVAVGRVTEQKDPRFLISLKRHVEAIASCPPFEWRWIGTGEPTLTAELESAGVTVTGWVAPAVVAAHLRSAHAMVHTARYEGMPIALLEGMAYGTPVLGRDIAPLREISIDRFRSGDEFLRLLEGLENDARWQLASTTSRKYVELNHSVSSQRHALIDLYGRVTGTDLGQHVATPTGIRI